MSGRGLNVGTIEDVGNGKLIRATVKSRSLRLYSNTVKLYMMVCHDTETGKQERLMSCTMKTDREYMIT